MIMENIINIVKESYNVFIICCSPCASCAGKVDKRGFPGNIVISLYYLSSVKHHDRINQVLSKSLHPRGPQNGQYFRNIELGTEYLGKWEYFRAGYFLLFSHSLKQVSYTYRYQLHTYKQQTDSKAVCYMFQHSSSFYI